MGGGKKKKKRENATPAHSHHGRYVMTDNGGNQSHTRPIRVIWIHTDMKPPLTQTSSIFRNAAHKES